MNTAVKKKADQLTMPIDRVEFTKILASELTGPLEKVLSKKQKEAGAIERIIELVSTAAMDWLSSSRQANSPKRRSAKGCNKKKVTLGDAQAILPPSRERRIG